MTKYVFLKTHYTAIYNQHLIAEVMFCKASITCSYSNFKRPSAARVTKDIMETGAFHWEFHRQGQSSLHPPPPAQ